MENIATKFLFPEFPAEAIMGDMDLENMIDYVKTVIDLDAYIARRKEEVKEDRLWQFARANFQTNGTPWEMSPGELAIYRAIVLREYPRIEIITCTQYGKKLSDDTPINTTTGWRKHGDLKIGDKLFSPAGEPIEVTVVFNAGKDVDQEIEFTNGEKIKCHQNHEWVVAHEDWARSRNPYRIMETKKIKTHKNKTKFSLPPTILSLKRKKRIRIKKIRTIKPENGKCIEVKGGIYLAGKKMIPTHNSLTISRGVLTRITSFPEEFLILSPDLKRGQIIIDYMVRDTANNEDFTAMLMGVDLKQKNMLMRLLEEHSKVKLTYQQPTEKNEPLQYGSVEVLSVQATRRNQAITGIMGFGGRNLICDESALTDDEINAGVFRMMAGKGEDTFLVKIGNPFFRNHFLSDWKDPTFAKIYVDYSIAMLEGRYTETFIKKALTLPRAEVLYECRFPRAGAIDSKGWIPLMTEEEIKAAMVKIEPGANPHFGEERTGNDPASEGENEAVIVKRSAGYAEILYAEAGLDSFQFAGPVMEYGTKTNSKKIYIDKIGVGVATLGKANEINRTNPNEKDRAKITGVNVGESARDTARFFNIRAEIYWRTREWIKQGGRLSQDSGWLQLAKIKYTATTGGKLQIMSKKDMRALNIPSPDKADALALTFYDLPVATAMSPEEKFFARKMAKNENKRGGGNGSMMRTR